MVFVACVPIGLVWGQERSATTGSQYGASETIEDHRRAQRLLWRGEVLRAVDTLTQALRRKPEDAELLAALGAVLQIAGQPSIAVTYLDRASKLRPNDWTLRLFFATTLQAAGQKDRAKAELQQIIDRAGNPGTLQIATEKLSGKYDREAEQSRSRARKEPPYESSKTPSFAAELLNLNWAALKSNEHDGGSLIPIVIAYTHIAPLFRPSSSGAPGVIVTGGDYVELYGASVLQTVLYSENHALVVIRPFHVPLQQGDGPRLRQTFRFFDFFLGDARARIEKLVAKPDMLEKKFQGFYAIEQGQTATALSLLREVVKLNPEDPQARFEIATAFLNDKQAQETVQHLKAALARWPDYPQALSMQGFIDTIRGDSDSGMAMVRRAISVKPAFYDAYGSLFSLYQLQGKQREAKQVLDQIEELAPDLAETSRKRLTK